MILCLKMMVKEGWLSIMANKTLIGPYSAYAIAVKHGYQGTEAEWAKTLIDAGNNAASAEESKTAAAQSAENAATSETNVEQAEKRINTSISGAVEAVTAQETKSVQAVAAQEEASAAAVTAEGERVLGTIPEDYTALSTDVSSLKEDLGTINDGIYDNIKTEVELVTLNSIGGFSFYGSALAIKNVKNLCGIKFLGIGESDCNLDVYIVKDAIGATMSDVIQDSVAHGYAKIGTVNNEYIISLDKTIDVIGHGWIVIFADKKISTSDYRSYLNSEVFDSASPSYYINYKGALNDMGDGNYGRWTQNIDLIVSEQILITKDSYKKTKNLPIMNYLYVSNTGDDETGDGTETNPYATIYHANEMITDNNELNQYTIIVKSGIYTDLQEKYAGTYSGALEGVRCKDYVFYQSEDIMHPENCIIRWDGSVGFSGEITQDMIFDKSPFHIERGHTSVKGFKIIASNIRYPLHIENSGKGIDNVWSIENCIIDWNGRPDVPQATNSAPCFGMGTGVFEEGLIKNCKCLNSISAPFVGGLQTHDNKYSNGYAFMGSGCKLKIENVDFGGNVVHLRTMIPSNYYNVPNIVEMINCTGITEIKKEVMGDGDSDMWKVVLTGTDVSTN